MTKKPTDTLLTACKAARDWLENDTLNDLDELSDDAKAVLETLRQAISDHEQTVDTPLYPRRNHAARRQDVARVLAAQPWASDRRIARITVVGRELVREVRREMVRTSQIQSHHALYRVGADGKTYTLPPKQRGAASLPVGAIENPNRIDLPRPCADSL